MNASCLSSDKAIRVSAHDTSKPFNSLTEALDKPAEALPAWQAFSRCLSAVANCLVITLCP